MHEYRESGPRVAKIVAGMRLITFPQGRTRVRCANAGVSFNTAVILTGLIVTGYM